MAPKMSPGTPPGSDQKRDQKRSEKSLKKRHAGVRGVTRAMQQKWAGRRGSPLTLRDQALRGHSKPYEHAPGARGTVADNRGLLRRRNYRDQ